MFPSSFNGYVKEESGHSGKRRSAVSSDYYVTCGNHGILSQMATHAREIAADLRAREVDAVLLVAT